MRPIKKRKEMLPCSNCGKKSYYISQNGLCKTCMKEKISFARSQIVNKQGPIYEKWKEKIIAGLERRA